MECIEATSTMYLVIDGEASQAVITRFTHHIQTCKPCSRRYLLEMRLKEAIARACQCVDCPEGFEERLRAILMAELDGTDD
jgi:anti-sigma factor (TIGR02949 family)